MRAVFYVLAAVGVLAVAAPASALTSQPVSETAAGPVAKALFSDPVAKFEGAGAHFAALAGDNASNPGLPVYFEPTDHGSAADEDSYAADPVRFMSRVDGQAVTSAANAPSTDAAQAGAAKALPNGR